MELVQLEQSSNALEMEASLEVTKTIMAVGFSVKEETVLLLPSYMTKTA